MSNDTKDEAHGWPPPMPPKPPNDPQSIKTETLSKIVVMLNEHWELLRALREAVCTLMAGLKLRQVCERLEHIENIERETRPTQEQSAPSDLTPVYIAHRLSGDVQGNLRKAAQWVAWLAARYYIEPVCPWITLASVWTEDQGRTLGLEIDRAAVRRCKLFLAVGDEAGFSSGMQEEADAAQDADVPVRNLTGFCFPPGPVTSGCFDVKIITFGIRRRIP
jgi:hypothetical protein